MGPIAASEKASFAHMSALSLSAYWRGNGASGIAIMVNFKTWEHSKSCCEDFDFVEK